MELKDLYGQIKNPIDDKAVIETIINVYAEKDRGMGGFYGKLVKTSHKKNSGQYVIDDADLFYASMFNKWKKSIVSMTKEEFLSQNSYGNDFVTMRNYLKNVADVTTAQEARDIIYAKRDDKVLECALEKYRWDKMGENSGWIHVCSRYLTAKKDKYPNVEHRLYLNTDSLDTYKLVNYLTQKFDEHKLPFYFKFDTSGFRDDTVVIYSATETLAEYIDILREIKSEHPDLGARLMSPPLLTGKIDGWIGYGSEPAKLPNGNNTSFNEVRTKLLEPIIDKNTKKWIMDHRTDKIKYRDSMITFQEYFARKVVEHYVKRLEMYYGFEVTAQERLAERENRKYCESDVVMRMGYTLSDIKSPKFMQSMFNRINAKIGEFLVDLVNGKSISMKDFTVKGRNGKEIKMYEADLKEVMHEVASRIAKNDPSFVSTIQSEIKSSCSKYGIDENKFCFDIAAKEKIDEMSITQRVQRKETEVDNTVLKDEEDIILTSDKVKSMLTSRAQEYYAKFGSNPIAIMNRINFNARVDYLVDSYFAPRVSYIIGEYVEALSNANGDVNKIDQATEYLYDSYDELVESLREYLRPFFASPPAGVSVDRGTYIDSFLEELDDKGLEYLELINKRVLEDTIKELEKMEKEGKVSFGG
ncbi:MAG: hypothetical protein K2L98_03365 [Bacilli bacterium]|nr:hypothetical protein [Bacilli bacterium]